MLHVHRDGRTPGDLEEGDRMPGNQGGREIDLHFIYLFFTFKKFNVKKIIIKNPS